MTATTTAPVFTPTTRFLPLWTREGLHGRSGRMHLAKPKSTTKGFAPAWCGHTYWVDRAGPRAITGEAAVLLAWADTQPTCALCLARVGAWEWEW